MAFMVLSNRARHLMKGECMGEYAEMMLDGTCCCSCGEFLGDGDGYAVYCASCQPDEIKPKKSIKAFKQKPDKIVGCLHAGCRKRFIDENAMKMHLRTAHIDKDALREKQEKDKKLNLIRNAAPSLLDALEFARSVWAKQSMQHDDETDLAFSKIDAAIKLAHGE